MGASELKLSIHLVDTVMESQSYMACEALEFFEACTVNSGLFKYVQARCG